MTNWLIRNGQTARIREMLWDPLALAALNQPPESAAAPVFTRVLAEMFGPDPRAAAIALPTRPLHEMYAVPARAYIEARGGTVRTGATATVHLDGHRATVASGDERWLPDVVIAAVPWFALPTLFSGDIAPLAETIRHARATAASPIVTVNLWFDRPILDEAFVGLPGRQMQWVFDKRFVFGDSASHLSLVSSGASSIVDAPNAQLIAAAHGELRRRVSRVPGGAAAARHRHPRAARDLLAGARTAAAPGCPDRRAWTVPRRRLDRHRAAGDDRERRPQRPSRR